MPGQSISNVLVVDDDCMICQVIGLMLHSKGIACTLVDDERDALAWLQYENYDLVLMDVHMPFADGFTVTRQIRALPNERRHIPILGITASPNHQRQGLEAGMNCILEKPFTITEFFDAIGKCVGTKSILPQQQSFRESALLASQVR